MISCKTKIEIRNCNVGTDIYRKNKKWNKKRKVLPHFSVVEEIYPYQEENGRVYYEKKGMFQTGKKSYAALLQKKESYI